MLLVADKVSIKWNRRSEAHCIQSLSGECVEEMMFSPAIYHYACEFCAGYGQEEYLR